jgi:hypothetical protein
LVREESRVVNIIEAFLLAIGVAAIALGGVLIGGYIVFKSKAKPGETFIGPVPKGEAFKLADPAATEDFPGTEKLNPTIAKQNEKFMDMLLGGKV